MTSDGAVRSATVADATELAGLHRETTQHAYSGIFPATAPKPTVADLVPVWRDRMARSASAVFVAEGCDPAVGAMAIVGLVAVDFPDQSLFDDRTDVAHLRAFYVRPGLWNRGWGAALHRRAVLEARERGAMALDVWVLEGNAQGRDWYVRHGYEPTGARLASFPNLGLHDEGLRLSLGQT